MLQRRTLSHSTAILGSESPQSKKYLRASYVRDLKSKTSLRSYRCQSQLTRDVETMLV